MNTYNIIPLEQRSQDWLDFRKHKIGSSDVAAIMGFSIWETPLECWKRILLSQSKTQTPAMARGTELESQALLRLNRQTGRNYQPIVLQSVEQPDVIASLDGYWVDKDGSVFIAEIKCPNKKDHEKALQGKIPEHYYPQVAHQQNLANADHTIYFSWDGISQSGAIVEYQIDEEFVETMKCQISQFLANLANFQAPEASDRDWMKLMDSTLFERAKKFHSISEQMKALKEEQDSLREALVKECCSDKSLIVGEDGTTFRFQKITRKGMIDYEKVFQHYDILDVEEYRKPPIESWRLSV